MPNISEDAEPRTVAQDTADVFDAVFGRASEAGTETGRRYVLLLTPFPARAQRQQRRSRRL
jgi:hypothetical protein